MAEEIKTYPGWVVFLVVFFGLLLLLGMGFVLNFLGM
jgi:hypothetical protein